MVALIQRVREASVTVQEDVTGAIGAGLLIFLGVHRTDTTAERDWLVRKCANLRIFPDDDGLMNRSVLDTGGQVLVVSQFTLYGNTAKGNRPSFVESAHPDVAEPLYQSFCVELGEMLGQEVPTGVFGAMMDVRLLNDGPVTLWVERRAPV
ncbi:MAG: D-tyrosyl-tRNA(Tyr) deacylase [Rhodothermales bacterium]|jgi:D-tyrosyl-tRNA(Tyr) deacylase